MSHLKLRFALHISHCTLHTPHFTHHTPHFTLDGDLLTNDCSSLDATTPIYYLRDPAAKDNSITHAAAARSNLDAAITMRSAEAELQNTIELRATVSEIAAPKPDLAAKAEKRRF